MKSRIIITSALTIALGLVTPMVIAVEPSERAIAQVQISEIDRVFAAGMRLFKEGSVESLRKAIINLERAETLSREAGDREKQAFAQLVIGRIYISLGEQQRSLNYFNQALLLYKSMKNSSKYRINEAAILLNIGAAHSTLGNKNKALSYYQESLLISQELGDRSIQASALNNIGSIYLSLGMIQKSINYYERSLEFLIAEKSYSRLASTMINIGMAYSDLGNHAKAINYSQKGLQIFRDIDDQQGEASALNNLGLIHKRLGEEDKAINFYKRSLSLLRKFGNQSAEAITLHNISRILTDKKQPELAIVFLKRAVTIFEKLRSNAEKLPRESREIYIGSVSYAYRDLANLFLEKKRFHEAQSILELLKVHEVNSYDVSAISQNIFPFNPTEVIALQFFEKMVASPQALSLADLALINNVLIDQKESITQYSKNAFGLVGNPQAIFREKPDAILIQNLVVGDRLWVIWSSAKGDVKTSVLTVTQKQLTETVDRLRRALGTPNSNLNDLKATSQQLYNWLLPPALQTELTQNPKTQLLFSLDHVTRYIPMAALYDGKQYLIQKHTISNLITTDTDMGDRLAPNGQTPNILALGTSKALAGFSALPNVEAELQAIVRTKNNPRGIYPGTLHLNEAFTANSLRTAAPHRILHIATHGSFNPKTITASFLLLGNGDKLPITDIATLTNLNDKHLVVLSACETGISSSTSDGTEISGISSYFLRRGAKSVLASLWNVNDASTALMMMQFYKNLATGTMTKSEAIRQVQRDFIAGKLTPKDADALRSDILVQSTNPSRKTGPQNLNLAHPYYWAPFILIGNGL